MESLVTRELEDKANQTEMVAVKISALNINHMEMSDWLYENINLFDTT
jgi:hypothetical protein